jgi:hypothetical protein
LKQKWRESISLLRSRTYGQCGAIEGLRFFLQFMSVNARGCSRGARQFDEETKGACDAGMLRGGLLIIYLIAIAARSEARIISTAQAEFFGGHVV